MSSVTMFVKAKLAITLVIKSACIEDEIFER